MTARALATRRYSMDMDIDVSFGSLSLAEGGFLDVCALPLSLAIDVFSRVPVDQRLRCSALCRSWRALLAHAGFYSNLDFSETSGVAVYSDALVCAAVTRAGKRLRVLDSGPSLKLHPSSVLYACAFSASLTDLRLAAGSYTPQSASFLLPAPNSSRLLANRVLYTAHTFSASLTNLRLTAGSHTPLSVSLLLATAPNLSCLVLGNVVSNVEDAVKILTNAAPFGPLRVLSLCVEDAPSGVLSRPGLDALTAALPRHASLTALSLWCAPLADDGAMDALATAAIAQRLHSLTLRYCAFGAATVLPLTNLVSAGWLVELRILGYCSLVHTAFWINAGTGLFGEAVRASRLSCLELDCNCLEAHPDVVDATKFVAMRASGQLAL